jgi:hypothetical protein
LDVLAECDKPQVAEEAEAAQRILIRREEKSSQTETVIDDLGRTCT